MNREELLKPNVSLMNEIPLEARNSILKIALSQIHSSIQDKTNIVEKVSNEYNMKYSSVVEIIGSYILILKLFLANNNEEFKEILKGVGFSASFIEELPLLHNREYFTNSLVQYNRKENRNLLYLKWIIDISLYNKLLNVNAKHVIIQISLKDEKKYTIEMDIKTFNKLRYNVALILEQLYLIKKVLP